MAKLYTYMIGIEPDDWTFQDTKECKKYGLECKGYYKLGKNEGIVLVGELDNIEDIMEMYFGLEIADEYLTPYEDFDWEDGRWITGGWKETKSTLKESKKYSYEEFQDICEKESNDIINFHEYKGAYFVILRTEEECERLLRVLCDKYRFEGTCYKIIDPYNPNYKCYEIMALSE